MLSDKTIDTTAGAGGRFTLDSPDRGVRMRKHHFLRVIDQLLARRKAPHVEWVFIALSAFLGTLLALLPADFKDSFGTSKAAWEGFALFVVIASGLATALLTIWVVVDRLTNPSLTSEQIYEEVEDEIRRETALASQQSSPGT